MPGKSCGPSLKRGHGTRAALLMVASLAGLLLLAVAFIPTGAPAAAASAAAVPAPNVVAAPDAPSFASDEVLVHFKPEAGLYHIDEIFAAHGLQLKNYFSQIDTYLLLTPAGQAENTVALLQQLPEVEYAELNYLIYGAYHPSDPIYNDPTKVYAPQLINAESAWDTTKGDPSIILAIVDSGVNAAHEDLAGRVLSCGGQICDFINNDANPADDQGHGTHVAGIAAASIDNGLGIVGIAPGVSILPVKVLNAANTSDWATISNGIIYAADHGARVINLSLGGVSSSDTLLNAIRYAVSKGALIVVAAGNNASDAAFYPAAYYDETFAVASTTQSDNVSGTSNYGSSIDIAAPGDNIWSTYWTSANPNTYASQSGTSMAAPQVSGVAGLLLSYRPALGPADLKAIIQQSARDLGTPGPDPYYGAGRVDAGAAMTLAHTWVQYTPTPTPTATATPTPLPTPTLEYVQRVNAGGTVYTDKFFQTWATDKAFATGSWGYSTGTASSSSSAVAGTDDDFLYQKYRELVGEYKFTVPNGKYDVQLKLAEFNTKATATSRNMTVTFEAGTLTDTFSVFALAGKATALDKFYYSIPVTDGVLNIAFSKAAGASMNPDISAIEVKSFGPTPTPTATQTPTSTPTPSRTPTPTNTPTPYLQRVNSGGTTFTDGAGQVWAADKAFAAGSWGYTGGKALSSRNAVAGTTDDSLYQKYRETPGEYKFTVTNGTYEVTLRFAEFVATTATDRNMTVSLEGAAVETFSVYGLVGKATALDKVYTTTVSDGVLNIGFARGPGATKDPDISAIKVQKK